MLKVYRNGIDKPYGRSVINWSHPLSRNLIFAALFDGPQRSIDLVRNYVSIPTGGIGAKTGAIPGYGVGSQMFSTGQYHNFSQFTRDTNLLGPLTVLWKGILTSSASFQAYANKGTGNAGSNCSIEFRGNAGIVNWVTPGPNIVSGPFISSGVPQTIAYIDPDNGTTIGTWYLNGVGSTGTGFVGIRNGSPDPLWIGQRQDGTTVSLNGTVFHVYIWNRVLSATEMKWIYFKPYDFLRPVGIETLVRTVAAPTPPSVLYGHNIGANFTRRVTTIGY